MPSHAALRPGPFDLYRYQGRHRKPADGGGGGGGGGTARNIAITAGVVAAVMSGDVSPAQAAPGMPGEDSWTQLRTCESGDNYSADTGNGYYGAYQLDLATWHRLGGTGRPSQAAPVEQDRLARALYRERGWSSWSCARVLGLRDDPSYGSWVTPLSIRSSTSFAPGQRVTVTGSAPAGALVTVYGTYYGQSTPTLLATVRAGSQGSWTASVYPTSTVTLYAVSGTAHSATVQATMLYRTTLVVPSASPYGGTYQVAGTGRPGHYVTVYAKPSGWSAWQSANRVLVDGAGNWSMVWRATTDFAFTVRGDGDPSGPTRVVPVGTGATPQSTAVTPGSTAATPDGTPATAGGTVATPGSAPATAGGTATTAGGTATTPGGTVATPTTPPSTPSTGNGNGASGRQVSGTAKPATSVTVYIRRPGHSAWETLATVTSDTHGYWSATLPDNGRYEYYAQSANGQASAVLTVP